MATKKYRVTFELETEVEFDDSLMSLLEDEEWRRMFYNLESGEDLACHLAYNMLFNRARLNELDGFADQPPDLARIEAGHFHPRDAILDTDCYEIPS